MNYYNHIIIIYIKAILILPTDAEEIRFIKEPC